MQWTACLAWWGVPRLAFWCSMGIRVLRMHNKKACSFILILMQNTIYHRRSILPLQRPVQTSFLRSYLLQLRLNLLPGVPEYLDGCLGHLFILHLQTLKQRLVGLCRMERCGVGEWQDLPNAKYKWTRITKWMNEDKMRLLVTHFADTFTNCTNTQSTNVQESQRYWWGPCTLSSSRPERMAVSGVTPSSSSSAVPSIDLFNSFTRALRQQLWNSNHCYTILVEIYSNYNQ